MITLVRAGSAGSWDRLITAVEEALRIGVTDAAAVLHILRMPDPQQRHRYAIALAEELAEFERPMPSMDDYDLLLGAFNEEPHGSSGARQRTAVLQGGSSANHRGELCRVGGGGRQGESQSHPLSGSVVGDGERRAGPARHRQPDSRCATARMKTLEEFDFAQAPKIQAARIRELAEGGYIDRSEPVVLIGECGNGEESSSDGIVSGRVPAEAQGSFHDRGGTGQRAGGSEAE